jgi:hypothetical protein
MSKPKIQIAARPEIACEELRTNLVLFCFCSFANRSFLYLTKEFGHLTLGFHLSFGFWNLDL